MRSRSFNFSLIELLIVVGILGALSALILPMFHDTEKEARNTVARSKMKDIQRAFSRFQADMLVELRKTVDDGGDVTNLYLEDIARYGLWPLFVRSHPVMTEGDDWGTDIFKKYELYNGDTGFGWRGQYLEYDGIVSVAAPSLVYSYEGSGDTMSVTSHGGQSSGSECRIPVLRDPYGGYYRILCPEIRVSGVNSLSRFDRLKRMVIVCTGPNGRLDTTTSSFIPEDDDSYVRGINSDDILAVGDDIVMRLMPTSY